MTAINSASGAHPSDMPEKSTEKHISPEYILSVGTGFMAAKTLLSAVELGVFTRLGNGPCTLQALETSLKLHPRSSRDFLDALVALGFLERHAVNQRDVYQNTAPTARFLDAKSEFYIGAMLDMSNQRLYKYWDNLTEALRTGEPQNELKSGGLTLFDALAKTPARHAQFLSAMTALSRTANSAIARRFDWGKYQTFVDVGCAQGDLAAQVVLKHPHLKGIGFDLPTVQPIFTQHIEKLGVTDALKFVVGDFFKDDFPQADVVLMGHILHDWNLSEKMTLLRKAWACLPEGGALVVYESMIDDNRQDNAQGLLMSLEMLIETRGGFDYTAADCMGWMKQTGFREVRGEQLTHAEAMVIAIK